MGKTSQKQKEKRLAGRVSLALAAGMFSVVPVAHGMPKLDTVTNNSDARSHGVTAPVTNKQMDVKGTGENNVVHWNDFSVAHDETVVFNKVNNVEANYMNIVTGTVTSAIDGVMKGGKNVYLINPNGVIFGATAQVNVGNLYVSTRDDFENLKQNFTGKTATGAAATVSQQTGSAVLTELNSDSVLKADVVSLIDDKGYVAATQVVMEGKNIRFLNANQLAAQDVSAGEPVITDNLPTSVTGNATDGFSVAAHPDAANVIFRANTLGTTKNTDNYGDGYIHVGNGKNLGTGKSYAVTINYTAQNLNQTARIAAGTNGETVGVVNYSLIRTANNSNATDDLSYINSHMSENFMLADNINASSMNKAIGSAITLNGVLLPQFSNVPFTGRFDGMYYTVNNLNGSLMGLDSDYSAAGLFAYTNGATIENVGVDNATFATHNAGGIVGYANDTVLRNVWNAGEAGRIGIGSTSLQFVGGIAGVASGDTQLTNAYNTGTVSGAGLIGHLWGTSGIRNAYNIGTLSPSEGEIYGIYNTLADSSSNTVTNIYTATNYTHSSSLGTEQVGKSPAGLTSWVIKDATTLSAWIEAAGNSISADGGSGKTWRYYANLPTVDNGTSVEQLALKRASLPMLTAFFKGTVSTDYNYNVYNKDEETVSTLNSLDQYDAKGIASKTYDAQTISPARYVEDTNGDYVYLPGGYVTYLDAQGKDTNKAEYAPLVRYNYDKEKAMWVQNDAGTHVYKPGKYVLASSLTAEQSAQVTGTHYSQAASPVAYYGANHDATKITAHEDNYTKRNAGFYALFSCEQDGYDLYGNNFTIDTRSVTVDISAKAVNKVYDGLQTNEYTSKEALADSGVLIGLLPKDSSVSLADTSSLTYDYGSKDVKYVIDSTTGNYVIDPNTGKNKIASRKITVLGTGLELTGTGSSNYTIALPEGGTISTDIDGVYIYPREVVVTLDHYTGISKTYDATLTLRDRDKAALYTETPTNDTVVESGNIKLSASDDQKDLPVSLDDLLGEDKDDHVYLAFNSNVTYDNKNVGDKTVKYTGITLAETDTTTTTTNDLGNYDLIVLNSAKEPVAAETDGTYTLTGTGKISPRQVTVSLVNSVGDKPYDGTSDVLGNLAGSGNIKVELGIGTDETSVPDTIKNEFVGSTPGVTVAGTHYVTNVASGAKPTPNVIEADHVAYTGVKLNLNTTDPNDYKNYDLGIGTSSNIISVTGDATSGYILNTTGTITPRNILSSDFGLGTTAVSKPYDGSTTYDGMVSGTPITVKNGLLAVDVNKVKFVTSGTANFSYKNGTNYINTADATDSGLSTAAKYVKYDVKLDNTSDATAIQNYTVDGAGIAASSLYHVVGDGTITKRAITVALQQATGIDKEYDGTADVTGSNAVTGLNYKTGNWKVTSGSLVPNDGTSVKITSATYSDQNVAYQNGSVTTKDIAYTVIIDGTKGANYNLLTANNTKNTTQTVKLDAQGTITPKALSIVVPQDNTTVVKTYDGNANVAADDVKANVQVTGWATGHVGTNDSDATRYGKKDASLFDWGDISAQYGNGASDAVTFKPQTAVGKYDVKYKGVQTALKSKNYTISNTAYGKGAITTKRITLTDLQAKASPKNTFDKTYDGLNYYQGANSLKAADYLSVNYSALGVLAKDVSDVTNQMNQKITIAQAVYTGKDAKTYTNGVTTTYNIGSSTTGSWMPVGNYEFDMGPITVMHSGTISQKPVTVALTGQPALEKTYDGKPTLLDNKGGAISNATIAGWFTVSGTVGNETLTVSNASGVYANPNAGKNKTINYTGITLGDGNNGGKASNYSLSVNQMPGVGTINARKVKVTSVADVDKTYDKTAKVLQNAALGISVRDYNGETVGNTLLDSEGKASITTLGSMTAFYGDLSGTQFTQNANVNRTSVSVAAGKRDVQYTGLAKVLGTNYELAADGKFVKSGDMTHLYGQGTINPAEIDLTHAAVGTGISRVYDGTKTISRADALKGLTGIDPNDLALLEISGNFTDSANVGKNKPVVVTVKMDSTTNATNYTLVNNQPSATVSGNVGEITPKTVTAVLTKQPVLSKTYDATQSLKNSNGQTIASAVIADWFTVSGTVNDETLKVSNATGQYKNKDVGTKTVNYSDITLGNGTNGLASNYKLQSATATGSGNITARKITVQSAASVTKEYDGNAKVTGPIAVTVNNASQEGTNDWDVLAADHLVNASGVLKGNVTGTYLNTAGEGAENVRRMLDRTVGTKDVSYNLQKALSKNYVIADYTAKDGGTITPKTLTIGTPEAVQKEYNATTFLANPENSFKNSAVLADLISKKALSVTGNYHTKNVGEKVVDYTLALSDNVLGNNYNFDGNGNSAKLETTGEATITQRLLSPDMAAVTKAYDRMEIVTSAINGKLLTSDDASTAGTVIGNDAGKVTLNVADATGTYDTKDAATGKKVAYTGLALSGAEAGNYKLEDTVTANNGVITPRIISASVDDVSRDYSEADGAKVTNRGSDKITVRATNNTDLQMLIADGLANNDGTLKNVGNVNGSYQDTAGEGAENVRRSADGNRAVLPKNVKYTNVASALKDNAGKVNYAVENTADNGTLTGSGKITPVSLMINDPAPVEKDYDRTTTLLDADAVAGFGFTGTTAKLVNDGTLTVTGKYDDKNVGTKPVNYTLALSEGVNAAGNNYNFAGNGDSATLAKQGTVTINPRKLIVNYTAVKEYNGNKGLGQTIAETLSLITGDKDMQGNVITGDVVNLDTTGAKAEYDSRNAGGRTVTYTGVTLGGTDQGNYKISEFKNNSSKITPREITFNIAPAIVKYYDGKTGLSTADSDGGVSVVARNNTAVVDEAVAAWLATTKGTGDMKDDDIHVGQITGVYGAWDPSGTFTANSHVKYEPNVVKPENVTAQDVLYYFDGLTGEDAGNYKLTNETGAKVLNARGETIATTAYFKEAVKSGTIKPLTITIDAIRDKWNKSPEKVYDGSDEVAGYLADGTKVTANDFFRIYYDADPNDGDDYHEENGDLDISYSVNSAKYAGANAGTNKNVTYSGFKVSGDSVGDFVFTDNNHVIQENAIGEKYAGGVETKGNIARRFLVVRPGENNTKIYDGTTVLFAEGTKYMASMEDAENQNATGVVGKDVVSVTYAANFDNANASVDPDADMGAPGWTAKEVTYTYKLSGEAAGNYTLEADKRIVGDGGTTTERKTEGGVKRREVYVDFKDGKGTGIDKVYDKTPLLASGMSVNDILTLVKATDSTGIVEGEKIDLDYDNVDVRYISSGKEDGNNAANVSVNGNGEVTTKTVYFQNLNLTGTDEQRNNYIVKAKNTKGHEVDGQQTLEGSGKIQRRKVDVTMADSVPRKMYDGTKDVLTVEGQKYANPERTLTPDDAYIKIADTAADGLADGDTIAALNMAVTSALYHDENAGDGIGVTYLLKWNNSNYELVRFSLEGKGDISKRTLTRTGKSPVVDKTYDGSREFTSGNREKVMAAELFSDDVQDVSKLLAITDARYDSSNTLADPDKAEGNWQPIEVNYILTEAGRRNYQFDEKGSNQWTYRNEAGGRIDRAKVTLIPDPATQQQGSVQTSGYKGTYTGFVNSEGLSPGALTFGLADDRSMTIGRNYTLLGYVNGTRTSTTDPTFVSEYGNYYFMTQPNEALQIEAQPSTQDPVIADKKFKPDDYAYNRISKDADVTRFGHFAKVSLQYAKNGVNVDENVRSGLASSMEIEGNGAVVNLAGGTIRTESDKEEMPEQVAEEAALPMAYFVENDNSSIDLEREGETRRSRSLLEILMKASENGEGKESSIVINTMGDEEDEEEDKESRGVVVADRSNIAIETQGNTVNLDQMIG